MYLTLSTILLGTITQAVLVGSITIIGGGDGPTSIFLAGTINAPNYAMLIVGLVLLLIAVYMIVKKKIPFIKTYDGVKDIPRYSRTMGYGIFSASILVLLGALLNSSIVVLVLGGIAIGLVTLIFARKYM